MAPDPRMLRAQRYPLHSAVASGDLARTQGLLDSQAGCQINRKYENSGQTPLHLAASSGCPAMIQLLISGGAIIDELDSVKQTALHYSMTNTRWGVMETLVKAGANVNSRRMKDGWTPLFLASIFGLSYKAKYLVDSGGDVLLADDRGWTPEDWAEKYGQQSVKRVLRDAPRNITEYSGKKYIEMETKEKLEVPVEFDEGISKLLAKIEVKRKAKIEEHKKLLLKIEKEKEEEEKRIAEEQAEKNRQEEQDVIQQRENERILNEATASINERQSRLEQEKESNKPVLSDEEVTQRKISFSLKNSSKSADTKKNTNRTLEQNNATEAQLQSITKSEENDKRGMEVTETHIASDQILSVKNKHDTKVRANTNKALEQHHEKEEAHGEIIKIDNESDNMENAVKEDHMISDPIEYSDNEHGNKIEVKKNCNFDQKHKKEEVQSVTKSTESFMKDKKMKESHNSSEQSQYANKIQEKGIDYSDEQNYVKEETEVPNVTKYEGNHMKENKMRESHIASNPIVCVDKEEEEKIEVLSEKGTFRKSSNEEQNIMQLSNKISLECKDKCQPQTLKKEVKQTDRRPNLAENHSSCSENVIIKEDKVNTHQHQDHQINRDKKSDESFPVSKNVNVMSKMEKMQASANAEGGLELSKTKITPGLDVRTGLSSSDTTARIRTTTPAEKNLATSGMKKDEIDSSNNTDKLSKLDSIDADKKMNDKKLIWEVHSDTFIKASIKSGHKKVKGADQEGKQDDTALENNEENISKNMSVSHDEKSKKKEAETNTTPIPKSMEHPTKDNISKSTTSGQKNTIDTSTNDFENKTELDSMKDKNGGKGNEEKIKILPKNDNLKTLSSNPKLNSVVTVISDEINNVKADSLPYEETQEDKILKDEDISAISASSSYDEQQDVNSCQTKTRSPVISPEKYTNEEKSTDLKKNYASLVTSQKIKKEYNSNKEYQTMQQKSQEQENLSNGYGDVTTSNNALSTEKVKPPEEKKKQDKSTDIEVRIDGISSTVINEVKRTDSIETKKEKLEKVDIEISQDNHQLPQNMVEKPICEKLVQNNLDESRKSKQIGRPVNECSESLLNGNECEDLSIPKKNSLKEETAHTIDMNSVIMNSCLPESIDDAEYMNKLKVLNNYRNFGAMYSAKNNFKKAEWAFKNGIKQTTGQEPKSKEQLRSFMTAEIEFRISRARCLVALGMADQAKEECRTVLTLDNQNMAAQELLGTS